MNDSLSDCGMRRVLRRHFAEARAARLCAATIFSLPSYGVQALMPRVLWTRSPPSFLALAMHAPSSAPISGAVRRERFPLVGTLDRWCRHLLNWQEPLGIHTLGPSMR